MSEASNVTNLLTIQAQQMMALFPASAKSHAVYDPRSEKRNSNGKVDVGYRDVPGPATIASWEQHLAGEQALVLGLACDDDTTSVFALDIDDRMISAPDIQIKAEAPGMPLYVHETKSKATRVMGFYDRAVRMVEHEKIVRGLARSLGLPDDNVKGKVELFPSTPKPGKRQQQLNMPYLGGRFGFFRPGTRGGMVMLIGEFLRTVRKCTDADRAKLLAQPKIAREADPDRGRRHAAARARQFAEELAGTPPGGRNDALNKRAFMLGTMVGAKWIEREDAERLLRDAVAGWDNQEKTLDTLRRGLSDGEKHPHPDLDDAFTEDAVALEFAARHAAELRFDHDAGYWFRWTGTHWQRDNTAVAFSEARDLAREMSRSAKTKVRYVTSKASFAASVERFARADRALVATQATWDRDLFLLGTPGGTVDLRTGELREARQEEYVTKLTAVSPSERAECPTWDRFLREASSRDEALIRFLQTVCGYAMTGDTREHLLVFVYGPGGNGKSVFLNAVAGVLGDYATAAAMDTFTETRSDRHPTDMAMLRGARLVSCAETSEGRAWAETRIKQMTGGDPITARFMRQDFFTYVPTFQLLIVGNHQPRLHNVTEAMRRRLAMVPFVHSPPSPDRELSEKLRAEWPGVLRWMIDGCLAWQRDGLQRPAVVLDATDDYFAEQDMFGQWLAQCTESKGLMRAETTQSGRLYNSWKYFAEANGQRFTGDTRWFSAQMLARGFTKKKSDGQQVYEGIRLRRVDASAAGGSDDGAAV